MNFYKNSDIADKVDGKHFSIELNDDTLKFTQSWTGTDGDENEVHVTDGTASINFASIKHDCSILAIDDKTFAVHNVLAETMSSKESIGEYLAKRGISARLILCAPFAAEPDSYVIIVRNPEGTTVSLPTGMSFAGEFSKGGQMEFMPSLKRVGKEQIADSGETSVSVQLCGPTGEPVAKAGITIYTEQVFGSTDSIRYVTDSQGQIQVQCAPSISGKFRVKLGFRFYTGVLDISK